MKIKIYSGILKEVIKKVSIYLDRDQHNEDSHLRINTTKDEVVFTASTRTSGISISLPPLANSDLEVISEGGIAIEGAKFIKLARKIKHGTVSINSDIKKADTAQVSQGRFRFQVRTLELEDQFSEMPNLEDLNKTNIQDAKELFDSLKNISHSADVDNGKPEVNGVLVEVEKTLLNFVATDIKRLTQLQIEHKANEIEDFKPSKMIVPRTAIEKINKTFSDIDEVELLTSKKHIALKTENYIMWSSLYSGEYPDYLSVWPTSDRFTNIIELNIEDLLNLIKSVVVAKEDIVSIKIDSNVINCHLEESDIEIENEDETEIDYIKKDATTDVSIVMHEHFITEFLQMNLATAENVRIYYIDDESPVVFKIEEQFGLKNDTIAMPYTL